MIRFRPAVILLFKYWNKTECAASFEMYQAEYSELWSLYFHLLQFSSCTCLSLAPGTSKAAGIPTGEGLLKISCEDLERGWSGILYSYCVLFEQTG